MIIFVLYGTRETDLKCLMFADLYCRTTWNKHLKIKQIIWIREFDKKIVLLKISYSFKLIHENMNFIAIWFTTSFLPTSSSQSISGG